jgi:hypothetical protein
VRTIARRHCTRKAARLFGAAATLCGSNILRLSSTDQEDGARAMAMTRAALGEAAFAPAWEIGQQLTIEGAIADATAEADEE